MSGTITGNGATYRCDGDCDCSVSAPTSEESLARMTAAGWWVDPVGWITLCPRHLIPPAVQREIARLQTDRSILGALMGHEDFAPMIARAVAAEREACAIIADDHGRSKIADAIRLRGER